MPMLLQDLAEETWASNQRTADRLDAEVRELRELEREVKKLEQERDETVRELDELRGVMCALEELRHRAVESARQATSHVLSKLPQAEGVWRSGLAALRNDPTSDDEKLIRTLLNDFESCLRLVRAARALWAIPEQLKVAPERIDELDQAEGRFTELAAEARVALDHRAREWRPADPARLALGLQLAQEGKTIKAAEARARFRRS
jgi:DNA repair ATPase RecN